eukprot:GFUD01012981.1.p1 GENE.GFUD01012981.1~~GFUD01012981.1.p1  ORF type:complete len:202 (+),score=22.76 GFUD01012981.1:122-727(+)
MPLQFEQTFEMEEDEEVSEEMKGSKPITVANGTAQRITFSVGPIKMVEQGNLPDKTYTLGAGIDGQFGVKFSEGNVELKTWETEKKPTVVAPHSIHYVDAPLASLSRRKKGKAAMVENTLNIHIFQEMGAGKDVEVGLGYDIGPGHGIIVSDATGQCEVYQMQGRHWCKKTDPWLTNMGVDRSPHQGYRRRDMCPVSLYKK